jgi:hypothetical protein
MPLDDTPYHASTLLTRFRGISSSCRFLLLAHKKRARDDDDSEKQISRPRHNHGRRSSITLPDEGTLVDTSKFQVYKYMFGEANIGRLFKGFQVASAPTVNTFDTRVTLSNLSNFM